MKRIMIVLMLTAVLAANAFASEIRVKYFRVGDFIGKSLMNKNALEVKVNTWFAEQGDIDFIDIKFQDNDAQSSAMVIYRVK